MRNFNDTMIRHCLFMSNKEYNKLIGYLTNGNISCSFPIDGINYEFNSEKEYEEEDIHDLLSEYFDVKIKSVHIDDNESNIGVWIYYEEF